MYRVIIDCGMLSSLIPIFFLFYSYRKADHKMWWPLFFISTLWMISEILNWTLVKFSINNLLVFELFGFLSMIAYGFLFYRLISNKFFRISLIFIITVLELFLIVYAWANSLWFEGDMLNAMISAVVPFLLSILFFYNLMTTSIEGKLVHYPFYWVNAAILIGFGMSFFTFIFIDQIIASPALTFYLWPIVSIANIIYNILISKGIWQMRRV